LLQQRNLIKLLNDRLYELGQLDDGTGGSEPSDDEDADILAMIDEPVTVPPMPSAHLQKSIVHQSSSQRSPKNSVSANGSDTSQTSTLRLRKAFPPSDTAAKTSAHTFNSSNPSDAPNATQILESHTTEQTSLTEELVALAGQLKASAQMFADDLAADNSTLETTENALGKNKEGMDKATQRMGVLRKMSEGRWWWGRMALYAGIAALWIVAILLVFLGPKLRF
jgi:hypothetical protein